MTDAVITAAFEDFEQTQEMLVNVFEPAVDAIKRVYPETKYDVSQWSDRLTVRILNSKYFWSSDIINIDFIFPVDWRDEEKILPMTSKYRHGSGGENDGFDAKELLSFKAEVFDTAKKVIELAEQQEQTIRLLKKSVEEKKFVWNKLCEEKNQSEKERAEVKTRKEVAKLESGLAQVKSFKELEGVLKTSHLSWVNAWVNLVSFEINGDSFCPNFYKIERDACGRRNVFYKDNVRTSKKSIEELLNAGRCFIDTFEDIKMHEKRKMSRKQFNTADVFKDYIDSVTEKEDE